MKTKRGLVNKPAGIISRGTKRILLGVITVGMLASAGWIYAAKAAPEAAAGNSWEQLLEQSPLRNTVKFSDVERYSLFAILAVAVAGLLYAAMLAKQVMAADKGTPRMQEIARAVREGANAYLAAQFRKIGPLIIIIAVALYFTKYNESVFAWGRAGAFLIGAVFSWLVGFVGMRLATTGNLRVAAAARHSYGEAMQLGYRTGTITGMLTDGLGLLGGTCIFLVYGEQAYEALLGFGFGGTLLALVHARRRRHLHEGRRRRRRPGRQGRGRHPRGRSPQRRDDRRQRRRQRRRLRRHGRRHLRKLRSDDRRRDDPRHGQLRPQGRDFPAAGPRHRRARLDPQHLHGQGRGSRHLGHGVRRASTAASGSAR